MKKQQLFLCGALFLSGISMSSCQKEMAVAPTTISAGKPVNKDIQANYPGFDWDNPNTTTMPVATGQANSNFVSPVVYVPWRSSGGTPLDPGIVNDYHKVDGWDMVFNSFAPDNFPNAGNIGVMATSGGQPAGGLYFALYNRYRGILRFYLYIPPGLFGASTQISHGLGLYSSSNTSKMLNFEGTDIVDPTNNSSGFSKTNKDGVATTGGWYAMQYQIAYDPAFAGTTFPNPGFKWDSYSIAISQINLNGTEEGGLKGTIVTPAPDNNWLNAVFGVAEIFGTASVGITGAGDVAKSFASAAAGGLAGSTQGFFSGIFGGNSETDQSVDLALNANITTNGTSTSFQPYQFNSLVFPSQSAGTNGVAPLTTYPLGLFNMSGRPVVKVRTYPGTLNPPRGTTNTFYSDYTLDATAVQNLVQQNLAVFNSDPTNGARLDNFKAEVVAINPAVGWGPQYGSTKEVIGQYTVYTGSSVHLTRTGYGSATPPATSNVAVRVSFNVTPNNPAFTAKKIFIVKTFLANGVFTN